MNIRTRLMLGFGIVLALSGTVAATGIWNVHALRGTVFGLSNAQAHKLELAKRLEQAVTVDQVRTTVVMAISDDVLEFDLRHDIELDTKLADEAAAALTQVAKAADEKTLLADIDRLSKGYVALRAQLVQRKAQGSTVADDVKAKLIPLGNDYLAQVQKLVALQQHQFEARGAAADTQAARSVVVLLAISAIALAAGIALAFVIARSIVVPLLAARRAALAVAEGDLSNDLEVSGQDEAAQLMRAIAQMTTQLRRVVGDVRGGVEHMSAASHDIARGNQDLSTRTEQQAASLQQTAASMEQMTSTLRSSADNATQANRLALSASEVAARGGQVVGKVVTRMDDISASSKKIAEIVGVIDGIAFQTNILALNAAVEAARAGEQGRGFAVVASEVRNLAQRSSQAAREIKGLISDSVAKVESGAELVNEAGKTMGDIVLQVKRVTDLIGEITTATLEQTGGLSQVNQAVSQLDQMTQQNAALVEQSAAAAGSLSMQAVQLSQAVSVFKLHRDAVEHGG